MMRRTTLGSLTPSQANSRASLGPARLPAAKRKSVGSAARRKSTAAPPVSRRLSTAPTSNAANAKSRRQSQIGASKDPRPVSDKGYISKQIRNLIKFLTEMGYNHPVSPKLLTAPSVKDFLRIFQFLFAMIDPNHKFGGKYEEEIPLLLRGVGYPFTVNKSALFAVGSPHAWPNLLASLTWMIELIQSLQKSKDLQEEKAASSGLSDDKAFFAFCSRSYRSFLNFDDDYEALEDDFQNQMVEKNEQVQADVEALRNEKEALSGDIANIKDKPSPLECVRQRQGDISKDMKKFAKLIDSLIAHKKGHEAKLAQQKKDIESLILERKELSDKKEEVENALAEQTMSQSDAEQLKSKKTDVSDKLSMLKKKREDAEGMVWEREMVYSKSLGGLEESVARYNKKAEELHLIPSHAKNAHGVKYELRLDVHASNPEEILSIDLKSIKPSLRKLNERLAGSRRELEEKLILINEQCDQEDDHATSQSDDVKIWQKKVSQLEGAYQDKKKECQDQYKKDMMRADEMERQITTRRGELCALQEEYHQLHNELNKQKTRHEEMVSEYNRLFLDTLDIATQHKFEVQEQLEKLKAFAVAVKDKGWSV